MIRFHNNMILLFNVKITNQPLHGYNLCHRGRLQNQDRLTIWKYCLASLVPLMPLVSKIIIYAELSASEYATDQTDTEAYIRDLFPDDKLILHWYRNNSTNDWRTACERDIFPVQDDLIMCMGNDDHIFIDSSLQALKMGLDAMGNSPDPYIQLQYSHWPEAMRKAVNENWLALPNHYHGSYKHIESFTVMKKARWHHYWFDHDFGDQQGFFRPECLEQHQAKILPRGSQMLFPMKELFRHFDGYTHAGEFLDLVPPLSIPTGFFETHIQIAYGYPHNKPNCVNIDPAREHYVAHHELGADYKFTLNDIPMFWTSRITSVDINPSANLEHLLEYRDQHIYDQAFKNIPGPHVPTLTDPPALDVFQQYYHSELRKSH